MSSKEEILSFLDQHGSFNTLSYAAEVGEEHQRVVGIIKSLQGLGQLIQAEQISSKCWELTDEGREVAATGSHEAKVYGAVPPDGILQSELMASVPNAKVGFSKALSCGWVTLDKTSSRVHRKVKSVTDVVQHHLVALSANSAADVSDKLKQDYKKRKLLQEVTLKSYNVSKGAEFTLSIEKTETDLTPELLASGEWRTRTFKSYNFDALGAPIARGHLHPLLKVRAEFRQIFLEMGFSEMPTNQFVESSFWNFDALFQPQQHPARDAQDTFFIADPATSCRFPSDYLERVRRVHSVGGYGSRGYGSHWKLEDAQKNILRTHTTAVSARMLYRLAQQKEFRPVRYFSIDRVYRNETLDATHLAEFHQIEGVVAERGLTLGDLMGVINEFFRKLGIERIRFKPAYNPYTEPSMEIFSWHPGLRKWVEVGNSGMFRPEMLLPMGLPADVNVIAWGLSLERPTMIKYQLDNIRDLCGHRVNLQMVSDNPICRLDKTPGDVTRSSEETRVETLLKRQQAVLQDLSGLKLMLNEVRSRRGLAAVGAAGRCGSPAALSTVSLTGAVVEACPNRPPLAVAALCRLMAAHAPMTVQQHVHSTCNAEVPAALHRLLPQQNGSAAARSDCAQNGPGGVQLRWIWKPLRCGVRLRVGRQPVDGEAAAVRLLARQLDGWRRLYGERVAVDAWLDRADTAQLSEGGPAALAQLVERAVAARGWLVGSELSLADLLVWSVLQQNHALTPRLHQWAAAVAKL